MECFDINGSGYLGRTSLAWAARNRHEEVVKILLGGKRSIRMCQIMTAKHRSRLPLSMEVREWCKFYSSLGKVCFLPLFHRREFRTL